MKSEGMNQRLGQRERGFYPRGSQMQRAGVSLCILRNIIRAAVWRADTKGTKSVQWD